MDYATWDYPALKKEAAIRGLGGRDKKVNLIAKLEHSDSKPVGFVPGPKLEAVPDVPKVPKVPREVKDTDPDPDHPGFPNWDMRGRWRRRPHGFTSWEEEDKRP
jgi:hypothetical protein